MIYLTGSLRNPRIPVVAQHLRAAGFGEVFDDWYSAGPEADDKWRDYEKGRGHSFVQALQGHAAKHVCSYDEFHLRRCDVAVLLLPAGKSAHMELAFARGMGKKGYIVLDKDPDRFDVMYRLGTGSQDADVFNTVEELIHELHQRR